MIHSRFRDHVEGEVVSYGEISTTDADRIRQRGGVQREVDLWLAYDLSTALRSISLNRYRHRTFESPARAAAINDVRFSVGDARAALAGLIGALVNLRQVSEDEAPS